MVLQQSIHYPDVTTQVSNNRGNLQLLERGKEKWEITKTLIRTTPNGFTYPYYLDKDSKCIYYNVWMPCTSPKPDFPLIGEVEYTEEEITVWNPSWTKKKEELEDEKNN